MASTSLNLRSLSAHCGFSTCTISRVLSGRAREFRITEETEQKILRAARAAGYRPNYLAHSLYTGRTHTIGLLLANRVDGYLGGILEGVEARLRGTPNRMVVATCENDPELQRQELEAMTYRRVDGVILYPLARPRPGGNAGPTPEPGQPTVMIGRSARGLACDEVMLNDEQAGREAARRALAAGARTFAVLTNATDCSSDRQRVQSFVREIRKAGRPDGSVQVVEGGFADRPLPAGLEKAEAFFGVNSGLLLELLARLGDRSARTRRQLIGVGEIEGRDLLRVRVDTLPVPSRELGRQSADLLLWRLDHPAAPIQKRVVDFTL